MTTLSGPMGTTGAQPQEILLESGTNEVEILAFDLGNERYGVNVAKVREVIHLPKVNRVPHAHEVSDGVFKLREEIVPLYNLRRYFGFEPVDDTLQEAVIVMEFSNIRAAFRVDSVDRIYRLSYDDINGVPGSSDEDGSAITSIAEIAGDLVMMVDFERMVMSISGMDDLDRQASQVADAEFQRSDHRILHAEDSPFMRKSIDKMLRKSGYTQVMQMPDGEEAWNWMAAETKKQGVSPVDVVITDIEMPKMDGLHLTKRIKEHPVLKVLPVIVFSSLVSPDNEKKCRAVGADSQITKPNLAALVSRLDEVLRS